MGCYGCLTQGGLKKLVVFFYAAKETNNGAPKCSETKELRFRLGSLFRAKIFYLNIDS